MAKEPIGLIGFPTLLDHMMTRMLEEFGVSVERFDVDSAAQAMSRLRLAFFFWPDRGDQGSRKMKAVASGVGDQECPIVIVVNQTGVFDAKQCVGREAADLLTTPLKSREVADMLLQHAKIGEIKPVPTVNIEYVNSLLKSTLESLEQLTGLSCERTSIEYSTEAVVTGFVTGTVGFSGSADGYLTVAFPRALAVRIATSTMSARSENATEIEISTSVSELIGSIANAAKNSVCNLKECLQVSAPQVFAGGPHIVTQHPGVPVVILKFKAAEEIFSLLIHLRPKAV